MLLGVHVTEDCCWTLSTTCIAEKTQQRVHSLLILKRAIHPILATFNRGAIESVLTSCDHKALQWIVGRAGKINEVSLPIIGLLVQQPLPPHFKCTFMAFSRRPYPDPLFRQWLAVSYLCHLAGTGASEPPAPDSAAVSSLSQPDSSTSCWANQAPNPVGLNATSQSWICTFYCCYTNSYSPFPACLLFCAFAVHSSHTVAYLYLL